jgi:hypothetical protein
MRTNPEKGAEFVANDENCPLVDIERVVDIMSQRLQLRSYLTLSRTTSQSKVICKLVF